MNMYFSILLFHLLILLFFYTFCWYSSPLPPSFSTDPALSSALSESSSLSPHSPPSFTSSPYSLNLLPLLFLYLLFLLLGNLLGFVILLPTKRLCLLFCSFQSYLCSLQGLCYWVTTEWTSVLPAGYLSSCPARGYVERISSFRGKPHMGDCPSFFSQKIHSLQMSL